MKYLPQFIKRPLKLAIKRGNKVECPLCGFKAKEWQEIGHDLPILEKMQVAGAGRRRAGCYKCFADDRERLIYFYLRDELKIFGLNTLDILHIAPEHELSRKLYSHFGNAYIAGDKFTSGYSYPKYVKDMDILNLPFSDNQFDLLICNHVLEHIPDDLAAMRELNRVLKKGGRAILQVPFSTNSLTYEDFNIVSEEEKEQHFGQRDHVRIYGSDYFDRLEAVGFTTERVALSKDEKYSNYDLSEKEEVFIAVKS